MAEGLVSRLRRWVGSLLGRGSTAVESSETDDQAAAPAEPAFKCDICGTPVDGAEGPCPLCQSEAIVPVTPDPSEDPSATTMESESGPNPAERRIANGDTGESAASLADLRESGKDLLTRYPDKWNVRDSGGSRRYRVSLPEGGERVVDSREDVRSLLFRHYGTGETPDADDEPDGPSDPPA